jgi:hypothetical protein
MRVKFNAGVRLRKKILGKSNWFKGRKKKDGAMAEKGGDGKTVVGTDTGGSDMESVEKSGGGDSKKYQKSHPASNVGHRKRMGRVITKPNQNISVHLPRVLVKG